MKQGRKLGQTSLGILRKLLKDGGRALNDFIDTSQEYDKRIYGAIYKSLYSLGRGGYIRQKRDDKNQSFFHLTPKGRLKIFKYLHLEKLKIRKWDGHWRVIIFDIPERLRKWREYMRLKLKELGFHPLQESVYITPYFVTGELDEILKEWGLRRFFRYLTLDEIDGEKELKKIFNLK